MSLSVHGTCANNQQSNSVSTTRNLPLHPALYINSYAWRLQYSPLTTQPKQRDNPAQALICVVHRAPYSVSRSATTRYTACNCFTATRSSQPHDASGEACKRRTASKRYQHQQYHHRTSAHQHRMISPRSRGLASHDSQLLTKLPKRQNWKTPNHTNALVRTTTPQTKKQRTLSRSVSRKTEISAAVVGRYRLTAPRITTTFLF